MPTPELATEVVDNLATEADTAQSVGGKRLGDFSLSKLLAALILLVVCIVVSKLILKATARILSKTKTDATLHAFINSALRTLLIFVTIMLMAGTLGIDTSSLLAVFGMLGLAVSLSVQDSLSNIVSGVQLLASKPFRVGDFVNIGGQDGTVEKIGLLHTILHTLDNQRVHIPNSQITSAKIINATGVKKRRVDFTFCAGYDFDIETVKAALLEAAQHEKLLPDEELFARASAYKDSAIEYTVRVWTKPEDYWTVYFDVLENVKKVFDARGIAMTYPHINVHMIEKKAD